MAVPRICINLPNSSKVSFKVSNLTGVPAGMVGIPLGTTVARNGSFPAVKSVA